MNLSKINFWDKTDNTTIFDEAIFKIHQHYEETETIKWRDFVRLKTKICKFLFLYHKYFKPHCKWKFSTEQQYYTNIILNDTICFELCYMAADVLLEPSKLKNFNNGLRFSAKLKNKQMNYVYFNSWGNRFLNKEYKLILLRGDGV